MITKFSILAVYVALFGSILITPSFAMESEGEDHRPPISGHYNVQRYHEEPSGTIQIEQKSENCILLSGFKLFENSTYSKRVEEEYANSGNLQEQRIGSFIRTDMPTKSYALDFFGNKINPQYGVCIDYNGGEMQIHLNIEKDEMWGYTYDLYVTEPTRYKFVGCEISSGAPAMRFILQK